jgi:hypothetical protein
MTKKIKLISLIFILSILSISCKGGKMSDKAVPLTPIENINESIWRKLSQKKIYFGHQSVGNNIIKGLEDILNENPR